MFGKRLTELTNLAAPTRDDLLYLVNDPSGAAASRKATLESVITGPSLLVAASDAAADAIKNADYVCDGTNDEVQIQAAIDALPAGGGRVQLSEGTFVLSWAGEVVADAITTPYCVLIDSADPALEVCGVPGATILQLADTQPANTASILLRGTAASPRTDATYIDGIVFDGNEAGQVAVWTDLGSLALLYTDDTSVSHCRFINHTRNGLHVFRASQKLVFTHNYGYGLGIIRVENMHYIITNNIFEDDPAAAAGAVVQIAPDYDVAGYTCRCQIITNNVFIGGSTQLNLQGPQACIVSNNSFASATNATAYAIKLQAVDTGVIKIDAQNNVIAGNTTYNCANGIYLVGTGTEGAIYNLVALNSIMDGPDCNISFGIRESGGTSDHNRILFNYIDSTAVTKVSVIGANTVIEGNANYVTENHGAAAGTADGGVIAHGCAAAPTVVIATGSVASEFVSVTAIGAANFTVAIKDDAGNPGANQTVYWRAWV